jgi:PGF-pre-PGF domain-containing protein
VAVIAVVLVVVAAPLVPGVVAQEDDDGGAPTVPASYYGDVTVNGDDAEAGTEIVALIDGEERGSIEIAEAGSYGGPGGLDEKLVVDGSEDDDGKTVTFEVRGAEAEETVEWESGDVQEVDLTFEDVPEADDSDGSDNEDDGGGGGGGGGGGAAPAPTEETEQPAEQGTDTGTPDSTTTPEPDTEEIDGIEDVDSTEVVNEASANVTTDADSGAAAATFEDDAPVEKVTFESDSVEGSVEVAEVSEPPEETGSPPGSTTTVTDIQVPDSAEDQSATVELRVSNDRLAELDAAAGDLRIHRYSNGEWQTLDTRIKQETQNGVVLEADTPGFSFFAASAIGEPDADLSVPSAAVDPGTEVTLDATNSEDPYGEIERYEWSIDGETLTGETASLALDEPGEYTVELVVTNDAGETDTATGTLVVSEPSTEAGSSDTAAAVDGGQTDAASDAGTETLTPTTGGSTPPLWLLAVGAVVIVGVLVATAVLRDDGSSQERL